MSLLVIVFKANFNLCYLLIISFSQKGKLTFLSRGKDYILQGLLLTYMQCHIVIVSS